VVRLGNALARPALPAGSARKCQGDDARESPSERQLNQVDHLVVHGRQVVQVVLVLAVARWLGGGGARSAHASDRGAAVQGGELSGIGFFYLAPAVNQAV